MQNPLDFIVFGGCFRQCRSGIDEPGIQSGQFLSRQQRPLVGVLQLVGRAEFLDFFFGLPQAFPQIHQPIIDLGGGFVRGQVNLPFLVGQIAFGDRIRQNGCLDR